MFDIASDITVERLEIIFSSKKTRSEFLSEGNGYEHVKRHIEKLTFEIKHLEQFKKNYPDYEYTVSSSKKEAFFSVWCAIVEREVVKDQNIFSKLERV